ncbi:MULTISPECIES: ParM/StbA family protein [Achromobacter]|uniref:ParM/StbA family protein n=1 Tax=Achromobacter denitrificans TaxID=32002 RepID=A0ABZ3FUK2_ACHDE|nr:MULTISPECIES: ParM/StbA family protein [Achromobacter]MDH0682738.1 ParM/StbA family protein [Achromobacter animicus]QYJ20274.1 ParM/StbA family protein [Achromobacter sp. ES-001]CAB3813813.1 hypothetical protein LMG26684_00082 [Achromobacter mucicolens]CAB3924899.1 hypothetical protein LMG2828_05924 [Achromobacter piechaudii]
MNRTCIGLDIGRSAVKVVSHASGLFDRFLFPSDVCEAFHIADEATAAEAANETVAVEGRTYFTGETARLQGGRGTNIGMDDDWIEKPGYKALVASALARLKARGVKGLEDAYIVIGSPSNVFDHQKDKLAEITKSVAGTDVKVIPQPAGAYFQHVLNQSGVPVKERFSGDDGQPLSWAVIEIGHFTTDFLLVRNGRHIAGAFGSCDGMGSSVKRLAAILADRGIRVGDRECHAALIAGSVKHFGQKVDVTKDVAEAVRPVAQLILAEADTLLSREVSTLDGVLLAGGGAVFLAETLSEKWPHTILLEEPRMAVANGFCRFAVGQLKQQSAARTSVKAA